MIPPAHLIRGTALVGFALAGLAAFWGVETAMFVAIGAGAAVLNLGLLVLAAAGVVHGGVGAALMPMKLLLAVGLIGALTAFFPPVPVLIGFGAGPLGVVVAGLLGARRLTTAESR